MVRDCRRCPLCEQRNLTVFGEGSHQARLMFIGEGPGADEDRQGRPFVGRAGQLLTKMIQAMKFTREEVYIGNIVKCRPPRNRVPEKEEAAACLPYLNRQIKLINPEVLVLLGATPLQYLLNLKGINRQHGQWHEYLGIPTLPTFHPAYLLRSPNKKREAWADLQKVMARLRRAEG
jgi:DNA polymerase